MPLNEYTRYALYMAVMDDEIARRELDGAEVGGKTVVFEPRVDTLQYRYHLFLELNKGKQREDILQEIKDLENRLPGLNHSDR